MLSRFYVCTKNIIFIFGTVYNQQTQKAFLLKKIEINAHEQRNDMNACYLIHISRHFNMQAIKSWEV